jgi:solute carrier family 10 (sodium/bile acid cotransporter), member 7
MPARFTLDAFTWALVGTMLLASLLPVSGPPAAAFDVLVKAAVMTLFFLHGARLPHAAVRAGIAHWRLHLAVLASTFALFPLLGLLLGPVLELTLGSSLALGMLFICCLPSTVQSSIAFTSIAGGNVPAAVVAASFSNILGIVLTPLLTGLLLARSGALSADAFGSIATLLLLPFVAGQLLRPLVGAWVVRFRGALGLVDRGSILLMVYAAFSKAVIGGLWLRVSGLQLVWLVVACCVLLGLVLALTTAGARRAGFTREDEIPIVFCGSKKSLVTGVPMANVLFPGPEAGMIVLPLMVFHQIQLLVCAWLAHRYAKNR